MHSNSVNVNGQIVGGNVASPCDLTLDYSNIGTVDNQFNTLSGRLLICARSHNSAYGTKSVAAGFQTQVKANNTNPLKSKLIFLNLTDDTVRIIESGSIDADGLFSCASVESTGTTLNIASQNNTNTVNIGSGAGVQAINVGNSGTSKTTIKLGGGTDEVLVNLPLKDSVTGFNILSVTSDASTGNTSLGSKAMSSWTGTANTYIGSDIASWNR